MKKSDSEQQVLTQIVTSVVEKQVKDEQICLVTNHTMTIPPYHISIMPLKPMNCTFGINL